MGFKRRWQPSASQRRKYAERMRAIEAAQTESAPEDYSIDCTGDCCNGDEIAFFNAGKSDERLYGIIVNDSYGAAKQQHTFTIELLDGEKMMIKGRNLYKMGVLRKNGLTRQKGKQFWTKNTKGGTRQGREQRPGNRLKLTDKRGSMISPMKQMMTKQWQECRDGFNFVNSR